MSEAAVILIACAAITVIWAAGKLRSHGGLWLLRPGPGWEYPQPQGRAARKRMQALAMHYRQEEPAAGRGAATGE